MSLSVSRACVRNGLRRAQAVKQHQRSMGKLANIGGADNDAKSASDFGDEASFTGMAQQWHVRRADAHPGDAVRRAGDENPGPKVTMYFDGGCPICTKEVSHYQKLDAPTGNIKFHDIAADGLDEALLQRNVRHGDAVRRMHLYRHSDGQVLIGAPTFFELWKHLPGFKYLAPLGTVPGVMPVADWLYGIWADKRLGLTSTSPDAPPPRPAAQGGAAHDTASPAACDGSSGSACAVRANIGYEQQPPPQR